MRHAQGLISTPIPTLTHKNHFEFGFTNGAANEQVRAPVSFRDSSDDQWFVRYGRCQRMPGSFREECLQTARRIRENTGLPIDLFFSGGVDSEVALRSFLEAGIDVRVLSLRFKNDLNAHDVEWVKRSCLALGVTPRFVDLDLLKFWETEGLGYAERTQCVSPQLLSTMWLADQTDGFCVLGSGENFIVKRVPESYVPGETPYLRSTWDLFEKEKIAAWYRHFIVRGRDAAPGFFQYTPEIMLSWFFDEMGCDLWNDRIEGKRNSVSTKMQFYQRHFAVLDRPKFTGFENVIPQDAEFRRELRKRFDECDHIVKTPVPWLIREMLPMESENQISKYVSEFSNSEWGEEISFSKPLPEPVMIDGRIYYT